MPGSAVDDGGRGDDATGKFSHPHQKRFARFTPYRLVSVHKEGRPGKATTTSFYLAEDMPQSITEENTSLNWRKANMEETRKEEDGTEWPELFADKIVEDNWGGGGLEWYCRRQLRNMSYNFEQN
jgi:hypothetical protein